MKRWRWCNLSLVTEKIERVQNGGIETAREMGRRTNSVREHKHGAVEEEVGRS